MHVEHKEKVLAEMIATAAAAVLFVFALGLVVLAIGMTG